MSTTFFSRVTCAAAAMLCLFWPASAGAQIGQSHERVVQQAVAANFAHATAAERCDLAEMATQIKNLELIVSSQGVPIEEGLPFGAARKEQRERTKKEVQLFLEAARNRPPQNCPKPPSKGISIGMGGGHGMFGLSGVGLGYAGEEYAGLSPDTVHMSEFDGSIEVNVGGRPWRLWLNYDAGLGLNGFKYPVGQEPYGGIYTGRSPSGATSVDTREKGLEGKNRVELRNFYAGGEIPIFKAARHTFTYFTFDRLERTHVGTLSAQATFSGNTFFFNQQRVQNLDENRFGAGIGRRFQFQLGSRFTFESSARAGAYYRRASLASVEHVTGNVMPQQDRDFTIQIRDTSHGIGFMGEFGATLEVPLSSQIALSGGGSVRILSTVSSIVNPRSSREIDDGGRTRIGTERAMSVQLGLNLVYRLGGK
jgi:hypothetical protein